MDIFGIEETREKHVVWDNDVPIIEKNGKIEIFVTEEIMEPRTYNEMCYKLLNAPEGTDITLNINTPGGMIDSAFMIIDAIKSSKANVTAKLSGTVASAGTIITLACPKVEIADHTAFMIHNYSAGVSGKGHEMRDRQKFMDKQLNAAFKEFYTGFLSEEEMEDVIEGKDMWLTKSEVEERLANRDA